MVPYVDAVGAVMRVCMLRWCEGDGNAVVGDG